MTKSQVQKNNANLLSERPRLKHEWNHAVGWLNNLRYGIAAQCKESKKLHLTPSGSARRRANANDACCASTTLSGGRFLRRRRERLLYLQDWKMMQSCATEDQR